MFVKKIPRWKIKRFIKGCIRTILFFVIISSFVFCCSASPSYVYEDFEDFVGSNGFITYHLRAPNDSIIKQGDLYPNNNNLNDFILSSSSVSQSFDSVLLTINDSSNVQQNFTSRNSVVLVHDIIVELSNALPGDDYAEKFTVDVNYITDDSKLGEMSFRFEDALKSYDYITTNWGSIIRYSVDINSVLPNVNGTITSIDYHFYDVVAQAYSFRVCPSAHYNGSNYEDKSMIYYVGDSANAPIYDIPSDDPLIDLNDAEEPLFDLYNGGIDQFVDFYDSFANNNQVAFFGWVRRASSIFSIFFQEFTDWQFAPLIDFLLIAGIFGFILSIAGSIISKAKR